MKDLLYHFSLRPMDFGQLIDGLCARQDSWAETAKWFRGESKERFFMIEECRDEDEAQQIADHYSEIIETLQAQAAPQRSKRRIEPVDLPKEGTCTNGWCLFTDSLCGGLQPAERSDNGFWVYSSERDAQDEWANDMIDRCYQFLKGKREFDAIESGLFVASVELHSDGSLTSEGHDFAAND